MSYKVLYRISVVDAGGVETIYEPGDVAVLDDATAAGYSHALIPMEEGK